MQVAYALTQLVENLDRAQRRNGSVLVFMVCYDCYFVQAMPCAFRRQAHYDAGECSMLRSSADVTQQGSRPKTNLEIMATSITWWQLLSSFGRHLGIFLLLFGGMWLTVHFLRLSPSLLYSVPAMYFVYLGATLVLGTTKRKRTTSRKPK